MEIVEMGFLNLLGKALLNSNTKGSTSVKDSSGVASKNERIDIQFQEKGGNWKTISNLYSTNSQEINRSFVNAEKGIRNISNATGRLRAKGSISGKIYDMK